MAGDKKESVCNVQRAYRIGGISVDFPYKAYGSQLAFMGKVVATLERSHRRVPTNNNDSGNGGRCHALLESPTGTGKSLALLCSTLAWVKHFKASSSCSHPPPLPPHPPPLDSRPATGFVLPTAPNTVDSFSKGTGVAGQEVVTDSGSVSNVATTGGGGFVPESFSTGGGFLPEETAEERPSDGNKHISKRRKYPTIFYATRTHSQITQVLREFRKTSYRVPMAVLAARKHYCTNKNVCKKKNIDEECKLLLKDPERSCFQFKNFHKVKNHYSLQKGGAHEIHDIEDLVGVGNSVRGCAYFAARSMALDAEIVFCPYGYLLNPVIRNAMEINLHGSIIILDEAHNIEDVAREAGSIDLETGMLEGIRTELEQLSALGPAADFYQPLLDMVQEMLSWIYQKSNSLEKQDFERYSSCWFGEGALQELELAGIHAQGFAMLSECAKKAIGAAAEAEADQSHLSGFSAGMLEGLFSVLNFMLKDNGRHLLDYRLVVQKYVKRDAELGVTGWVSCLSFWCLNPAVVFEEVASKAQSIILTSGTLSPIGSFATELGVTFEICMEAPHVIDMKTQVWAASVPKGLGNIPLNASYKHADGYAFQDALGKALEEIFKVTPDGALVFFPSYKLLEKLCDRWKATGQWQRLYEEKQLFIEPRGKMETFETMLAEYYRVVNDKPKAAAQKAKPRIGGRKNAKDQLTDCHMKRHSSSGAAFLAVCRGKVSEGIDFSDKNARVVIVVGIPFPNQKDMQVDMKKQYNTRNKVSRNLLSGDQWYCYQAFRALNQAVGRCIRHRHDYGAIILLDERYKRASNLEYMSKWLRSSIQQVETLEDSLEGLQLFFQKFKDKSPPTVSSVKITTADDVKANSVSTNQLLPRAAVSATQKESKKISTTDDKENAVCLSNRLLVQAAVNAPAKQRFLKSTQSAKASHPGKKQFAPRCDDKAQKGIIEVQLTKAECNQGPALRQYRSPLREILPQTRECLDYEPAQSGSVITLAESPTMAAPCSSLRCLRDDADEDSSARRCGLSIEAQWTPIASTVSNSSEVKNCMLLNTSSSHDTSASVLNKHELVTPCNLFEKNNEDILVRVTRTPEVVASIDPLVRSLTTDFMACNELSLGNRNVSNVLKLDYSLSASKMPSTQGEVPTEKDIGVEMSILCLKCGGSLLRALHDHCNWQKVTLKKKFLSGLMYSMNRCGECQPAEHTDVLVCELLSLHPLIEVGTSDTNTPSTSTLNQPLRSVWVEEDGCVFKPLFCPWCKYEHCIGAHVLAANRMNMNLVDMALLLCDALTTTGEGGGKCIQGTQCWETQAMEERCHTLSLNSFSKRASQAQTPPRPKLKLPRRD